MRAPLSGLRRTTLLAGGTATLIAIIIATNAYVLWRMHQQTLKDVQATLLLHSLTLSEAVEQTFRATDLVLDNLVERVRATAERNDPSDPQLMTSHEAYLLLKEKRSELPQVDSLAILDAGGVLLANSRVWPTPTIDFSDREYFTAVKAEPKLSSFVAAPFRSRLTGEWLVARGRPIVTARGRFIGEVVATMPLHHFETFFHATSLGSGYTVSLVRRDGMLLVRYPQAGVVGGVFPGSVLRSLTDANAGVARSPSPVDGEARIAVGRALADYPLVVIATRRELDAFSGWTHIAAIMVAAGCGTVAAALAAAFAIAAWWRQQERLRQSEARRAFAVDAADFGTWNYEYVTGEQSWSDRLRAILGAPTAMPATRPNYLDFIHPADRHIVEECDRDLNPEQPQFDVEYRIVHGENGEPRWLNSIGRIDYDENGRRICHHGIVRDVTARKQAEVERGELRRHLLLAQEAERLRLARELHDEAGQSVASVLMHLQRLGGLVGDTGRAQLHLVREQLQRMGKALHQIAWELRPPSMDEIGLQASLANYIAEWAERTRITADFHCEAKLDDLTDEVRTVSYRIIQEALTNIAKHAQQARTASILITRTAEMLRLTIEDDGPGMTAPAGRTSERGLGLAGMRERLALIGGELTIETTSGGGTTLFVRMPLGAQRLSA
ncbi:MAG TPA: ATP-binding protein [Pseudolabrys sp.]|nr:ATP-binding protein [Pseudolabrys sp.]